jgi:hypothetical protein
VIEDKMLTGRAGSYNSVQGLARWMLGMMMAVQFVLTAQACVLPLPVSGATTMTAPCEGAGKGTASCLIQCQMTADQVKPSVDFHFLAPPTSNGWADALFAPPASHMAVAGPPLVQRSCGPPLQILFCSFQS